MKQLGIWLARGILGGMLVVLAGCGGDNGKRLEQAFHGYTIGDWSKAEELTGKVLKQEPANLQALILNGLAVANLTRLDEAEKRFAEAARLAPEDFNANYYHGWILVRQEKYADALTPLRAAFKLQPRHKDLLVLLARCCLEQNLPEGLRYLQVLASFPEMNREAALHNDIGYLWLNQRDYAQAERYFKLAWMRNNNDLAAPRNLAVLYDQYLRNPQEALKHYRWYKQQLERGSQPELAAQVDARIRQLEREAPRTAAARPPQPRPATGTGTGGTAAPVRRPTSRR